MTVKQPAIKPATLAHAANVDVGTITGGHCDGCGVRTAHPDVTACSLCDRSGYVGAESGHANQGPY